jgi:hypothetical protein
MKRDERLLPKNEKEMTGSLIFQIGGQIWKSYDFQIGPQI